LWDEIKKVSRIIDLLPKGAFDKALIKIVLYILSEGFDPLTGT
jgi:hypothetical protein